MLLIYFSLAFVLGIILGSFFAPTSTFLLLELVPLPFLPVLTRQHALG